MVGWTSEVSAAGSQSLFESCWAPSAVAAKLAELKPVRGIHTFDQSIPRLTLTPAPAIDPRFRGQAVRRVELPKGQKLIALTFDLCETAGEVAGYDAPIFEYLRANKVKATFFGGGKWLVSHAERSRQMMAEPLFEIASHGWAHRNARLLAGSELDREILGPQHAYQALRADLGKNQCVAAQPAAYYTLPQRIALFRFPFGACNAAALERVSDAGLLAIQWDVSTGDPDPHQSAQAIANAILAHAKPGSIVLMHANGRGYNTAAALPLAIPKLRAQGYQLVTVSELLAAGTPVLSPTCFDSKPGDTDKYDRLFPVSRPASETKNEQRAALPR